MHVLMPTDFAIGISWATKCMPLFDACMYMPVCCTAQCSEVGCFILTHQQLCIDGPGGTIGFWHSSTGFVQGLQLRGLSNDLMGLLKFS